MPLFLVTKQDTVLQGTGYLVRAKDKESAKASVDEGKYIEETSTVVLDTLDTKTLDVTEISEFGEGQNRS